MGEPETVSTGVTAKRLGVSAPSLTRWARDGLITPAYRTPGGQYRWDLESLRDQLRRMPPPDRSAGGSDQAAPR